MLWLAILLFLCATASAQIPGVRVGDTIDPVVFEHAYIGGKYRETVTLEEIADIDGTELIVVMVANGWCGMSAPIDPVTKKLVREVNPNFFPHCKTCMDMIGSRGKSLFTERTTPDAVQSAARRFPGIQFVLSYYQRDYVDASRVKNPPKDKRRAALKDQAKRFGWNLPNTHVVGDWDFTMQQYTFMDAIPFLILVDPSDMSIYNQIPGCFECEFEAMLLTLSSERSMEESKRVVSGVIPEKCKHLKTPNPDIPL